MPKRISFDTGNIVGDVYACHHVARERTIADSGYSRGNNGVLARCHEFIGSGLDDSIAVVTGIVILIVTGNRQTRQRTAARETALIYISHTAGNVKAL